MQGAGCRDNSFKFWKPCELPSHTRDVLLPPPHHQLLLIVTARLGPAAPRSVDTNRSSAAPRGCAGVLKEQQGPAWHSRACSPSLTGSSGEEIWPSTEVI